MTRGGIIDGSQAWRGAALARNRPPCDICFDVCMAGNRLKQAAPGNVSTRVGFVGTSHEWTIFERNDGQNVACGNFREPPVQRRIWPSSQSREYTRSLGTFQSGSPPGEDFRELSRVATIGCRATEGVFQQSARLKSVRRFAPSA